MRANLPHITNCRLIRCSQSTISTEHLATL
uniref:Uncharacterized protein n=1 Tax=Anguilla anguilla TaxID=7936 RepID=A0A0E9SL68_ANGAN